MPPMRFGGSDYCRRSIGEAENTINLLRGYDCARRLIGSQFRLNLSDAIMVQDTIKKIEAKLSGNETIKPEQRAELVELLHQLKSEINILAETNAECAQTVASFTEVSTHEATRAKKDPELIDLSLKGLSRSVTEFEGSHPALVAVVNRISTTLSNMGI